MRFHAYAGFGGESEAARAATANTGHAPESPRTVALIDMNAFFAQVEQRMNPHLRGKPVLVGGDPTTRSIVAAASYEARPYGIKSGMSYVEALRLCPHAVVIEGNTDKYLDHCRRLAEIFRSYTDVVEVFSIDEAFLDLTHVMRLHGCGPEEIAARIKRDIRAELGLTCSVGIGPNKLVAKMAADWQKPDGLVLVRPESLPQIIWPLPVDELFGVGPRLKRRLGALGITTVGRLARYDPEILIRKFGPVCGTRLHEIAHAIDDSPVVPQNFAPPKSMGHSYTLPRDTDDPETIRWFFFWLADKVARRLRKDDLSARTVTMVARHTDLSFSSRSRTLPSPTCSGHDLAEAALEIFHKTVPRGAPVRLLGVSASSLVPRHNLQLELNEDPLRRDNLLTAMDGIKNKYGDSSITFATLTTQHHRAMLRKKIGVFLTKKEKI